MFSTIKKFMYTANKLQKTLVFGVVFFCIVGVFLHGPLGGYSSFSKEVKIMLSCSNEERLAQREVVLAKIRNKEKPYDQRPPGISEEQMAIFLTSNCQVPGVKTVYLPFDYWSSASPVVWWFGYIQNLIAYLISVLLIGLAGVIIFKTKSKNYSE